MITHVTDAEIQMYVTEQDLLGTKQRVHIQDCAHCRAKAASYASLFNQIRNIQKPAFDFDLSALVMEQLPAPKRAFPWAALLISILSIAAVAVSAVFFWSSLMAVMERVSILLLAAAAIGAVVVLLFQALEMIRAHHRQMNVLLRSKTLQL
jgi:hypothetical protein